MLQLKLVEKEEIQLALSLIADGKAHLEEQGIPQWQGAYPKLEMIESDISEKKAYFLMLDGEAVGYYCLDFGGEPEYKNLKGQWLGDLPYGVIHRMCISSKHRGKGLAVQAYTLAEQLCKERNFRSIRVDTAPQNKKMLHIIEQSGYTYCGTIVYADEGLRVAYEKLL